MLQSLCGVVSQLEISNCHTGRGSGNHEIRSGKAERERSDVSIGKCMIAQRLCFSVDRSIEISLFRVVNRYAIFYFQFEKTADHLFEAAYHGQTDAINGNIALSLIFDRGARTLR